MRQGIVRIRRQATGDRKKTGDGRPETEEEASGDRKKTGDGRPETEEEASGDRRQATGIKKAKSEVRRLRFAMDFA